MTFSKGKRSGQKRFSTSMLTIACRVLGSARIAARTVNTTAVQHPIHHRFFLWYKGTNFSYAFPMGMFPCRISFETWSCSFHAGGDETGGSDAQ